jgi:hypothetical protein
MKRRPSGRRFALHQITEMMTLIIAWRVDETHPTPKGTPGAIFAATQRGI